MQSPAYDFEKVGKKLPRKIVTSSENSSWNPALGADKYFPSAVAQSNAIMNDDAIFSGQKIRIKSNANHHSSSSFIHCPADGFSKFDRKNL